jgi:hypothetical protein
MFSFGGYLYPLVKGRKGMIYEFDYKTGKTLNQYSTKYYFYRGYEMKFSWKDLAKRLKIKTNYVKGTLQGPVLTTDAEVPSNKLDANSIISFVKRETVLYMQTSDHAVDKIRFIGKTHTYVMNYSSAGSGMKSKRNQKYKIAIPLAGMKADTYEIAVHYNGKWYDTGKNVVRNNS